MRRYLAALALAMVLPLPGLTDVVVKPGETLSEIAERNGVSLTQLMQANGITNPNLVVAGQKLVLPGVRRAGSGGASVTVRPGDTLSTIAAANGVSLTRLMQANGISNPNLVITGQRLVIPGARNTAAAPAPKHRTADSDQPDQQPQSGGCRHPTGHPRAADPRGCPSHGPCAAQHEGTCGAQW